MSDRRDEYGNNPVRQTDEYGNPVGQTHGGTMGSYGTGTDGRVSGGAGHAGGGGGHMQEQCVGGQTGILHRSGSSSSSSSEDDEQGGRRKKGMTQKIKEKIPGVGGKEMDPHHTGGAMGQQTGTYGQEEYYDGKDQGGCEKKGMTDKIKEKIPGIGGKEKDQRHPIGNQPMGQQATYGQHQPQHQQQQQQQGEYYGGQEEPEKKGIMDKIKEKLPGGAHSREV